MRDRIFYPIAALVVAAIIGLALWPARGKASLNDQDIIDNGYVLAGDDLMKLTAAPSTVVEYVRGVDGTVTAATLSSTIPKATAQASAGVFGTLNSRYENIFGGKSLEITVRARKGATNPLESFELSYFTAGAGNSGWQSFELEKEYRDFSFTYAPKEPSGNPGVDYIGIWPGQAGRTETMEVESVSVKIITP